MMTLLDVLGKIAWLPTEEEIREVFKTFDHENNGLMNTSELNEALQLLCIDLTEEEKQDPRYIIDGNPETVGEDEFVAFVQERFEDIDFMQRASESLRQFDEESCGTLTRDTMKVILTQRGSEPFSEEEAEAILKKFNTNEGGRYDIADLTKQIYTV